MTWVYKSFRIKFSFCRLHNAFRFLHFENDFQILDIRRNDHPFSKLSCTLSACKRLPNLLAVWWRWPASPASAVPATSKGSHATVGHDHHQSGTSAAQLWSSL